MAIFVFVVGGWPVSSYADFTFSAGGDVMRGNVILFPEGPYSDFSPEIKSTFQQSDFAMINLEGPIGGEKSQMKRCGTSGVCYAFSQPADTAQILKNAGVNVVSVANNHAGDMGISGINNTRVLLERENIKYAGPHPDNDWQGYSVVERRGKKICFTAFSHNRAVMDHREANAIPFIAHVAKSCPLLVVSMHIGAEGENQAIVVTDKEEHFVGENRGNAYRFARQAIDAGADIVIGHGPHVVRGLEVYKGKLIAYSLGNFLTARGISVVGRRGQTVTLTATLADDGTLKHFSLSSYTQEITPHGTVQVRDTEEKARTLMLGLSPPDIRHYIHP